MVNRNGINGFGIPSRSQGFYNRNIGNWVELNLNSGEGPFYGVLSPMEGDRVVLGPEGYRMSYKKDKNGNITRSLSKVSDLEIQFYFGAISRIQVCSEDQIELAVAWINKNHINKKKDRGLEKEVTKDHSD